MKNKWLPLFLILGLLLSPVLSLAQAADEGCSAVSLFNGWARSAPEGMPNGAVFGFLVNLSDQEDTLLSATTDVAEAVEFHETIVGENDVMQMQPVEGGFVVPPDGYLELKPGGLHIMLINLTSPLEAGSTFTLTLNFEQAGAVEVSVPVRELEAMDGEMSGGMSMDMEATDVAEMPAPTMQWSETCAAVHVLKPWVRPAAAGMPNSAAYALLLNLTETDETLVSASSEVAEAVELHEVVMGDNDVMRMQPVENGIDIPAGSASLLQPGGLHIMLINLTTELVAGDTVDMTLSFAEAGDMELTVPITAPEEEGMGAGGM
jgi:copper(I)-binding protein